MPKVSVVVPAYNAEGYVARCLESLIDQTLEDIEILVVNDGSTDATEAIANSFAARLPNKIRVLSKANGGLSSARNFGVAHASGDYIGFVDSDDFVEPEMFEHLHRLVVQSNCEISICRFVHHDLSGENPSIGGVLPFAEGAVFSPDDFLLNSHVMVVWNKIYRRDLIARHPQPHTWFEDVAWSPVIISHAKRICATPAVYYHYLRREDSIASSHRDMRTLQGIESVRFALENCHADSLAAVRYMAAQRLLFEARVRPIFADRYMAAMHDLRHEILQSRYVLNDVELSSRISRYLDPSFACIPTRLTTAIVNRRPTQDETDRMASWVSRLASPDTVFVQLDGSELDDSICSRLRAEGRREVLEDYLRLNDILTNGGVTLTTRMFARKPIGWALHPSQAFFAFADSKHVSKDIFAATAGHDQISAILALFIELIDTADPLQQALDQHLSKQGARWDYRSVEKSFGSRFQTLPDGTRVYASGIFINDFGFNLATTYRFPEVLARNPPNLAVTDFYRTQQPKFVADYTRWRSRRIAQKGRAKKKKRPEHLLALTRRSLPAAITQNSRAKGVVRKASMIWRSGTHSLTRRLAAAHRRHLNSRSRSTSSPVNHDERMLSHYFETLKSAPLSADLVLLEAFYGRGMISNPMALFEAWSRRPDFSQYRFIWVLDSYERHVQTREKVEATFANVTFVERLTEEYFHALATARYLINDVSFPFSFIKRPDQVYVNTWHSITVKSLGYDLPTSPLDQKNVVRNLLGCDYVVAPNEFMKGIFLDSHRLRNIMPGRFFVAGHPRNDLTLSADATEIATTLQELGLRFSPHKQTIVYAPTWRGSTVADPSDDIAAYRQVLESIRQSKWGSRYNVLLRPHQLAYEKASNVAELADSLIPPTLDANAMFTVTDILVTDYSSICFDFLVTDRPILFYVPDEAEYESERGLYFQKDELPGPVLDDLDQLVREIESLADSRDDHAAQRRRARELLLPHDDGRASERLLASLLEGNLDGVTEQPPRAARRVLICAGSLAYPHQVQGIESIVSWLKMGSEIPIDVSAFTTDLWRHNRQGSHVRRLLSKGIRPLARSKGHMVVSEQGRRVIDDLPVSFGSRDLDLVVEEELPLEWRRCFQDATFDVVIFAGKSTSPLEALITACAPNAHKILCTADVLLLKHVAKHYDVTFRERADLARYLQSGVFWPPTGEDRSSSRQATSANGRGERAVGEPLPLPNRINGAQELETPSVV